MAARCWDLDGLGRDYLELAAAYGQLPPLAELARLPGPDALRQQVELVASYRTLPFRDPDLPARLLPEGWPGHRAHALFIAAHDALHGPADAFVRDVLTRNDWPAAGTGLGPASYGSGSPGRG
jgi:phenylacetic acid degradation operon negative regulatory protein